jgi:hypothetical protein
MQELKKAGVVATKGYYRGPPQIIKLDVECTGEPKVKISPVLTKETVLYKCKQHVQFNSMYVCMLKVAGERHGITAQAQRGGIIDRMVQAWVGHFVSSITLPEGCSLILVYISLVLAYIRRVTTTRRDGTKSTNNRQTPSPCWWSRSPLHRRGFDESMSLEGRAAFRMIFPTPPSKQFNRFNKLK